MNRRSLLAGVSWALATAIGGCLEDETSADESRDESESGTDEGRDGSGGESDGTGDETKTIDEEPRVDDPPHEIERPDPPDDPAAFDEWNEEYLGEHMETDTDLAFDRLSVRTGWVHDTGLTGLDDPTDAYEVRAVSSEAEYAETFDEPAMDDDARNRLSEVDFSESILVVVESGFGSGSVDHRWVRVEDDGGIVHLHGYYTDPYEQTSDLTTRLSVLEVERPADDFEFVRASLTVDEDRRVHVNSTEGVVTLEE